MPRRHSYPCRHIIAALPSPIAYLGWCIPSPRCPIVSWSAYPIPRRQSYLGRRIPLPCHNLLSWPAGSFNAAPQFLYPTRAVPPHESISVGGEGDNHSAQGDKPPCASPLAVSKSKSRYHTRVGTIIALSKPISNQSLFLSLAPVITSRQQSLLYHPLPLTPRHTHLFPQSTTLPESFRIISTGTSSLPSHHILHQHTPLLGFNIFSSSRLIPSSATITRYVVPGRH